MHQYLHNRFLPACQSPGLRSLLCGTPVKSEDCPRSSNHASLLLVVVVVVVVLPPPVLLLLLLLLHFHCRDRFLV